MTDRVPVDRERVTFSECVAMCASDAEFVTHVERLTGHHFAFTRPRTPITVMVDEACGRDDADMARFVALVDDIVWSRIQTPEAPHADR